jgi:hypothetical protein
MKNSVRIGFQSIGGFPTDRTNVKEELIRFGISKFEFDIFGIA